MLTVEVGAKKYLIRLEHRIVASKFFNFGFNHTQVVKPVLAVLRVFCFGRPLSFLQELRNCWLVFSSLSCRSRPFKHGLICGQKLPVSAGALWWHLTVNGDSTGVWAGAKSGEKPGATLPWAGFFFYLFPLLPRPAFPLPGHGAPVQPSQRRQPPQQQPPALQTQALFAPSNSIHLQQVWNILKTEAQFLLSSLWCCLLHLFGSTVVFCVCVFSAAAAPQSSLNRLLHLSGLPHLPFFPHLLPPVFLCPSQGAQDPQGLFDPHPEPALEHCSHPHLAFLRLHLCCKVQLTRQKRVQQNRNVSFHRFSCLWECDD